MKPAGMGRPARWGDHRGDHCCGRSGRGSVGASACNRSRSCALQGPSSPHAHTNWPTHQIDLFCTAFAIMLHGLLPAPNGGSRTAAVTS